MSDVNLPLKEIELVAITRATLGMGIGLLVSSYFSREQRRLIGWTLVAIGGLSTIPLRANVLRRRTRLGQPYDEPSLAGLSRK